MRKGFTLIELLIVVLIIAILAAIAVPNFLEFQVRAKVSRGMADMRSMATAIEAYAVDNGEYAPHFCCSGYEDYSVVMGRLTTPISYITTIPEDPFQSAMSTVDMSWWLRYRWYTYDEKHAYNICWPVYWNGRVGEPFKDSARWVLNGYGPDQEGNWFQNNLSQAPYWQSLPYDPSNGTVSRGDIVRYGP
jgi:prepilin-type N-terminal cleavage/methylation domain-containing protein